MTLEDAIETTSKEKSDKIVEDHRQTLACLPAGSPEYGGALDDLGYAILEHFEQFGEIQDLEEAITYLRQALDLHPTGHPNHSASLTNLANAVSTRFDQLGKKEDLKEATTYYRQALVLCPPGHPCRSASFIGLANVISLRFDKLGNIEGLVEKITFLRQVLVLCPPGHPNRSAYRDHQPFHSSFELHDHSRLTLLDLIQARLPNAEFAFLSACHSAAGDSKGTPDEVIHLAAALQFCGFRSVVGALWAMEDIDGPDVAEDFYHYMFREPGNTANFRDSAKALDQATRAMRRRGIAIDRWIKFVHIGA